MNPTSPEPSSTVETSEEVIQRLQKELENLQQRLKVCEFSNATRLAAMPQIIWIAAADGSSTDFNPHWYEYTGLSAVESLGWEFLKAIHPEDREHVLAHRHYCQLQPYQIEYRLQAADGSYHWMLEQTTPVVGESGLLEWVGSCTDINNSYAEVQGVRKRAEEEIEKSEQRYHLLADAVPLIVWTAQPNGELDYYNQRWFDYTGMSLEETKGWGWQPVLHPEDLQKCIDTWVSSIQNGEPYEIEYRFKRKDGTYRWHLGRALPVRNNDEDIVSWVGTCTDIDDQKRVEEALKESEARFHSMADTAPVMVWVAGTDTEFTWFNQSWLNFTGRTLEQELSNGWAQGVHPDDCQCLDIYLSAFDARHCFTMEYRLQRADGEYRWILDNGVPRFMPNGEFAGYIGSCLDITDRKAAESALKIRADELNYLLGVLAQTNVALEKRNHELDQFTYVVSHDLKAPLRAIANLSQWIEEDLSSSLTEDTQHQMNLLRGRVYRMEALINGLLQYSRVGRLQTKTATVSVAALLAEVIDTLAPPETFTVVVESNMPTLVTQRLPLEQVFTNLIGNCLKHHPRIDGKVQISVQDRGLFYEFVVTDDGSGIAPQYHEKVFGIFQTLEARDKSENTGIGLAIVKKIVESQGGIIRLESQEEKGATFRFTWSK